mmetsp:Transcript_5262/g.8144  ORF Transcript_5262/g.8144 Transcript_5262/m.8144 type:complete len:152 (+) Transcript_5262:545-1000(+)
MNKVCQHSARKTLPDWVVVRFDNFKVGNTYYKQGNRSPKASQDFQVSSALHKLEEADREVKKSPSPVKPKRDSVLDGPKQEEPVKIMMKYGKQGGKPFISIDPSADLSEIRETFKKLFQQEETSVKPSIVDIPSSTRSARELNFTSPGKLC